MSRRPMLLAVSPDMVLATNVVLSLAGRKGQVATVRELSAELGMSGFQATDVLMRLAAHRIIEWHKGARSAYLSARFEALTLADIARATGEWLLDTTNGSVADEDLPGLREALTIVRKRCLKALATMRVPTLVGVAG